MTNTSMLEDIISHRGLKKKFLAEKLGITPFALAKKIKNMNAFKDYEIQILCEALGINSLKQKEDIFFAKKVDL